MSIVLYTTHCPKCMVLEKKLQQKNIQYEINENIEEMQKLGYMSMPVLNVDGQEKDFKQACAWIDRKDN